MRNLTDAACDHLGLKGWGKDSLRFYKAPLLCMSDCVEGQTDKKGGHFCASQNAKPC